MSKPRLHMGLVGFANEPYMTALLHTRSAVLRWEATSAADADALWISGEAAEPANDGLVRVAAGKTAASLLLDLQALERPTFFTLPMGDRRLQPPLTFDPHSAPSVDRALRRAEAVLHPLVMQLAIASEIAARLPELNSDTYHLTLQGKLVAIVNMGGSIGIDPRQSAALAGAADWRPLPKAASAIPQHFLVTSFAEVLWLYVTRVQADLLPPRYRASRIYFRAIPRVPARLMKDAHYAVLAELGAEPQTFEQLQHNVGLGDQALANALAVLYYAGAITTNPVRAAKGAKLPVREAESPTELRDSMFRGEASQPFSSFTERKGEERPTVPAPLESKPPG